MTQAVKFQSDLIADNQGLVHSLAWRIHRKVAAHVELDDLVGYGQVGLAEAARDFDPTRGVKFTTFAYYRVRGAILDGLSQMAWFKKSDYYRGRLERLANEVLHMQGADRFDPGATPADDPDVQLQDDVRWFKGITGTLAMVYLFCHQGDDEQGERALEDKSAASPSAGLINEEVRQKLHELIDGLPKEARELIRAAYFEGLTLKEAGARLGVSKSWASRLHAKTLGQLAQSLRRQQMAD